MPEITNIDIDPQITNMGDVEPAVLTLDAGMDSFERVTVRDNAGTYTLDQNNPVYVNQMCGVAWSYYDNRKDGNGDPVFTYGQTTCLDGDWAHDNQIDCSTLIGLVLRGWDFENGPYSFLQSTETDTGDGTDQDASMPSDDPDATDTGTNAGTLERNDAFEWSIDPGTYEGSPIRTAADLAEWFYRNGRIVEAGEHFEHVEKGDIVFYARRDGSGWVQPNRFMHISHAAVIVNKMDNADPDIPAAYPFKHTMIESTHFQSNPETIVNRCLEKVNVDSVILFARPFLGTISPDDVKGNEVASKSTINNIYTAGIRYLTSTAVTGLPDDVTNGMGMILTVERVENKKGKPYALIQRLIDARNNREWRRTQYCYSHDYTPSSSRWTSWVEIQEVSI